MGSPRPSPRNSVRLQKYLAACGIASRRACETLILSGAVTVDGHPVTTLGTRIDPDSQEVHCRGRPVRPPALTYIILNKPRDVLCTCSDPRGRRTFLDILPPFKERLFPVGRLDRNSEGLLLATNDGALAAALTHPRYGVPKTYHVDVERALTESETVRMISGIHSQGDRLRVTAIQRDPAGTSAVRYRIELKEGRNRHLRRMFSVLGISVLRLRRIRLGPQELGRLPRGVWRHLTPQEIQALRHASRLVEPDGGRNQTGRN